MFDKNSFDMKDLPEIAKGLADLIAAGELDFESSGISQLMISTTYILSEYKEHLREIGNDIGEIFSYLVMTSNEMIENETLQAELKQLFDNSASITKEVYDSYREAGFSKSEAMQLIISKSSGLSFLQSLKK